MSSNIVIYTDGAARGNPGPSASGFVVVGDGKILASSCVYNGKKTNNYAEYTAIIMALEWCLTNLEPEYMSVRVISDSELVVRQIIGEYKVKSRPLGELNDKVIGLVGRFRSVEFENKPREDRYISKV